MNKIKYQITVINLIKQIFKKIDNFYGNNCKCHVLKCDLLQYLYYFNIWCKSFYIIYICN